MVDGPGLMGFLLFSLHIFFLEFNKCVQTQVNHGGLNSKAAASGSKTLSLSRLCTHVRKMCSDILIAVKSLFQESPR